MSPALLHPALFLFLFTPIADAPTEEVEVQAVVFEQPAVPAPWGALADCESGEWDRHGDPIPDSRRWDYGAPGAFVRPGYDFDGGLNFTASTWAWVAGDLGYLDQYPHAYDAPPSVQVEVGQETQRRQGWKAWPTCARMLGLY